MPDENSTPVWTSQITQDNQATANQAWDDFMLDFWEWSNVEWFSMPEESENVEISLDETTKEEPQNEMNLNLDGGELFNENKKWENEENNIVIQDLDTIFNESQNDGFDISLGDDTKIEDKSDSSNDDSKVESDNFTEIDENKENIQVPEEKFDEVVSNEEIEKESDDTKVIENQEVENQESEIQETENQKIENENIIEEMHDSESTQENIEKSESEDVFLEEVKNDEEVKAEIVNDTENGWETVETTIQTDINDNLAEDIDLSIDTNEKVENEIDINQVDEEVSTIADESNEELDEEQNFGDESINKDISEVSFDSTDSENVAEDGDITEEKTDQDTDNTETDIFSDSDLFQKDDSSENETEINNEDVESQVENGEEQKIEDEIIGTPENSKVEDSENKPETLENTEWDIQIEDKETEASEQTPENLDFVMDFDSEEGNTQQEVKQPEIWDLMWDMNMDFSLDIHSSSEENAVTHPDKNLDTVENITDTVMENINDTWSMNFEENTSSEINDESEIKSSDIEDSMDNTVSEATIQNQNNEESLENVTENQEKADFVQSWGNSISQGIPTNIDNQPKPVFEDNLNQKKITEENKATGFDLQQAQAEQINNLNQVNNNVNEINNNVNGVNIQEKAEDDLNQQPIRRSDVATLSLDQILDSELNSNPQYADNSKAVPKNVPSNSWFFSKKTMWIIAVISLFAVAGYVAVLAFPSKNTNREPQEVVTSTWDQDHFVWYEPTTEPEEYTEIDEDKVNTWDDRINPVKSQVSFPDAGWEDWEIESKDPENQELEPYYCTGDECLETTEIEEPVDILSVEEIKPIILDYKSSAEKYYSLWDDTQDKKLIKYALQIINLCDSYDSEIENEEWATQESIDNFKSQVKTLMTKMEKYVGGWEEVQTFTQSNFNEEYDFEWKDELKEYINSRDNY